MAIEYTFYFYCKEFGTKKLPVKSDSILGENKGMGDFTQNNPTGLIKGGLRHRGFTQGI
jgi:hypothetical protein